jgi:HEAT repeat protein
MTAAVLCLLFGSAIVGYNILHSRNRMRVWQDAAVSCGLQIVQAYPGLNLQLDARAEQAEVRFEPSGGSKEQAVGITVEASGLPDFHKVKIHPETGSRAPEIEIGDTVFDSEFIIQGPVLLVSALLDEGTRRLLSLVNARGEVALSWGKLRADMPDEGIARVLPVLLDLRKRFTTPLDIPRRLAENAREDLVPGVRLHNLLVLLRELPEHPVTAEALRTARSDRSPEVRLRVARELGAEGRGILLELAENLENDAVSAEAVSLLDRELPFERATAILDRALSLRHLQTARVCLEAIGRSGAAAAVDVLSKVLEKESAELAPAAAQALGATGSPAAEPSLIVALQRDQPDLRVAAANALARVGSAEAVLPLKEMADLFLLGEIRKAARQAIAEIQSRVQGASPGQLSLAGTEAGQLSLAEAEAGQLSLAEDPAGQLSLGEDK